MGNTRSTAQRGSAEPAGGPSPSWRYEVLVVTAAMAVYFGVRAVVEGSTARSVANAQRLLDLEAAIGIDVEADVQRLALDSELVRSIGNLSYVWLHWPLLFAALILLFLRDPSLYRRLRNALVASGSVGLLLFTVVPMAPPRFMPGFVGTVSDDARRHYIEYPIGWANRYAAFPSFHVGWTLVACLAVAVSIGDRRWRVAALIPAVLVGISVITTGNHYLLDSAAGALIALAAYGWAGRSPSTPGSEPVPAARPETIRTIDLPDGRRLVVRAADGDDLASVRALYGRLSTDDLRRRFFVGRMPPTATTTDWLTVGERGGLALVVDLIEGDGTHLVVAEAGFALLDDGDAELGITVDPAWQGWLGGWLLDVLAGEAAARGIPNLQAEVMVANRAMLARLRHRGHALVTHPDWNTIRLVISTDGHTPGWPPASDRRRLLVAAPGGRWAGEAAAEEAGFEVRTCPGPSGRDRPCPLLVGDPCPLLDGADALVFDLVAGSEPATRLLEALGDREIPVVITRRAGDAQTANPCLGTSEVLARIVDQLTEDSEDRDHERDGTWPAECGSPPPLVDDRSDR